MYLHYTGYNSQQCTAPIITVQVLTCFRVWTSILYVFPVPCYESRNATTRSVWPPTHTAVPTGVYRPPPPKTEHRSIVGLTGVVEGAYSSLVKGFVFQACKSLLLYTRFPSPRDVQTSSREQRLCLSVRPSSCSYKFGPVATN